MNTHNIINEITNEAIKEIPVLRVWHSFNAEKLQNIDGQGKDLLPLPNIKDLVTENGTVNFPYIDILLEESKIAPQILVYSGELSPQQEQLFEDLHERAKAIGGKVFPINYEKIKDKLTYGSLVNFDRILKLNQAACDARLSDPEKAKARAGIDAKADFIDLQRLAILYDMNSVFDLLEKKYPIKFNLREMLYADFDREIQPIMNLLENNASKENCASGILLPADYSPHAPSPDGTPLEHTPANRNKEIAQLRSQGYLKIQLENNFVYCGQNNSSFIREVMEKASNEAGVFQIMCETLLQPIKEVLALKKLNSKVDAHELHITLEGFKTRSEFTSVASILDTVIDEISKIGILGVKELEGTKDLSWRKDLPTLILEDYEQSKISTKLTELAEPEAQEINKLSAGL